MQKLTVDQIEQARMKTFQNACELLEEADLLLREKHFARAYALAHLSCEEMAKLPMLVRAATDLLTGEKVDWAKLNKKVRSHKEKIAYILHVDNIFVDDDDFEELRKDLERIPIYNQLKNLSLYAEQDETGYIKPSDIIGEEIAASMVKLAHNRMRFFKPIEEGTQNRLSQMLGSNKGLADVIKLINNPQKD